MSITTTTRATTTTTGPYTTRVPGAGEPLKTQYQYLLFLHFVSSFLLILQ